MEWQLAEAKNKFSELVTLALTDGPQRIRRRNDSVIVLNKRDYDKLVGKHTSFKDFIMGDGPSFEGLDIRRDKSPMRDSSL